MFNFGNPPDRHNTNCVKWDAKTGNFPLWIADMDFECAPPIKEALLRRVEHGVFGYTTVPDSWYDAYISWWKEEHGVTLERGWLSFCNGIVPAISAVVRALTEPEDEVVLQTPVYNMFFASVKNSGRTVIENHLLYDGEAYSIDLEDLEEKLARPKVKLFILCNPHNPTGNIWDKKTLTRIGNMCRKHQVRVVADEIHCDITAPEKSYVPFAACGEENLFNSVICLAPSKAFNLAGLQTAAIVVPDEKVRAIVLNEMQQADLTHPNSLACIAAEAAFTQGKPWLDELRSYVFENRKFAEDFFEKYLPEAKPVKAEATYLLWLDCKSFMQDTRAFSSFLQKNAGIILNAGEDYGADGAGFMRLNLACSHTLLEQALDEFAKAVELWKVTPKG